MALDWDKLRVFHAAAEAGSFTHAAEKLHCRNRRSPGRSARSSRMSACRCSTAMRAAWC